MTAYEACVPQPGGRMTPREVRALQPQERYSLSVICGARITVREVRAIHC